MYIKRYSLQYVLNENTGGGGEDIFNKGYHLMD